jgi:hypothetical protein
MPGEQMEVGAEASAVGLPAAPFASSMKMRCST